MTGGDVIATKLKEEGQRAFEDVHGTRGEFMRIFGRNYLPEPETD